MRLSKLLALVLALVLVLSLAACGNTKTDPTTAPTIAPTTAPTIAPTEAPTAAPTEEPTEAPTTPPTEAPTDAPLVEAAVAIALSDEQILVDGVAAGTDASDAVYVANDIVYYEAGHDFTYGEGEKSDEHTADEAAAHTVVHITKAGTYTVSGKLSKGQIAIDLGDDAKKDPAAVVTLILNGVDITREVAPAVIFYNVYECGSDDAETATYEVDTSAAGANVIIADGTVNNVKGSHVARIYKPGTQELNAAGTEVLDAKKLHKYDAAFYSRKSMNVNGGALGTGVLNIIADNEGLDSELHLTINGGNINIESGNDGINTNEDGISVTTINGGSLRILVTGETGEGDGIDSNGWLVFNGGTVITAACSFSMDAGIDSDMGIYLNGGTVISTGGMLDHIVTGGQNYAVFSFSQKQDGKNPITLKNEAGEAILEHIPENNFTIMVFTSPELVEGTYTLWSDGVQQAGVAGGVEGFGGPGGFPGGPGDRPEPPEGGGHSPPLDGGSGGCPGGGFGDEERTAEFVIFGDENSFSRIGPVE